MNEAVNNASANHDGAPGGTIVLGAACTIREVAQLRSRLLSLASQAGPYEIDASAVEAVDTAGVQVLVAFALDCLERNARHSWRRSAALEEAVRVLGVGALLESPA